MTTKVRSILSYIGILWLVAFFVDKDKRDDLSVYHLKQGLGLWLSAIIFNGAVYIAAVLIPSVGVVLGLISFIFLIFMVFGIINAANEVKKPLPVIGKLFEDKFDFIDS